MAVAPRKRRVETGESTGECGGRRGVGRGAHGPADRRGGRPGGAVRRRRAAGPRGRGAADRAAVDAADAGVRDRAPAARRRGGTARAGRRRGAGGRRLGDPPRAGRGVPRPVRVRATAAYHAGRPAGAPVGGQPRAARRGKAAGRGSTAAAAHAGPRAGHAGLGAALANPGLSVTVVDLDEGLLEYVDAQAGARGLDVRCLYGDLRLGLPPSARGSADLVFTDPPYTPEGVGLFLARGLEGLRDREHGRLVLAYGYGGQPGLGAKVQQVVYGLHLAYEAVLPGFNRYDGAEAVGAAS